MKVAFFDENGKINHIMNINLNKEELTIIKLPPNMPKFSAFFLNYEDEAFIKVLFDETSLKFFSENLHKIDDKLTRNMIWRALYEYVSYARISSEEFYNILEANIF